MDFPAVFTSKSGTRGKALNRRSLRRKALRAPISIQQPAVGGYTHMLPSPHTVYVERAVGVQKGNGKPVPKLEIKTSPNPLILWVGEDYDNLFAGGALYGFDCRWSDGLDLSILSHAKCIVVSCAETIDKLFNFINFACEYGIPSIWLNRSLPPEVSFWSLNKHFHVDDSMYFWRDVCHLTK